MRRTEDHPSLLLIDDCEPQRGLYEAALAADFDVVTATRGIDGLTLAATIKPYVIVLDVLMPEMNGWETCTRLKRDPATESIPVILLTGANDGDLADHAVAVGASAALTKPCPADRLMDAIHVAIRESSAH